MGDPRKQRKKYRTPTHPWQKLRIEEEKKLKEEYGLKNKKEIWKAESILRKFKRQAKSLIARDDEQSKKEEKQMMDKLYKLNLVEKDAKLDDVLGLNVKNILDRRLQAIVFKNKLARTINQARQFITHGHVFIKDRLIDVPSYFVLRDEEDKIGFVPKSGLFKIDHPERVKEKEEVKTQLEVKTKKEKVEKKEEVKKEKKKVKERVEEKEVKIEKGKEVVVEA